MANKDAAFGLRPVGKLGSDINNAGTSKYIILEEMVSMLIFGVAWVHIYQYEN